MHHGKSYQSIHRRGVNGRCDVMFHRGVEATYYLQDTLIVDLAEHGAVDLIGFSVRSSWTPAGGI